MQYLKKHNKFIHSQVIHLIGIGGIGMSGLANLLHSLGFIVQGSDIAINTNILRLKELGIKIYIGHKDSNINNVNIVVISSAIKEDNIELITAKTKKLSLYKRGEILGEVMGLYYGIAITGAHGKTTTTSLIGEMLLKSGLAPTVIVGGVVNDWKSNLKLGQGKFFVAEADESDGSFLNLPSIISVVTNIENEHLDYYKTVENLKKHFMTFINKIPFFGKAIVCIDDKGVKEVLTMIKERNICTYGTLEEADYKAFDIKYDVSGTEFNIYIKSKNQVIPRVQSKLLGLHNVLNALAAFVVTDLLDLNQQSTLKALEDFQGINRRFTKVGDYNGVQIFDDYAHHPSEIKAVLQSARELIKNNKIISIVQPHRYSRLKAYFEDFVNTLKLSDEIFVLPVYSAGEEPNEFTSEKLVQSLHKNNCFKATLITSIGDLKTSLLKCIKPGDIIINMGAGDITKLAKNLQSILEN